MNAPLIRPLLPCVATLLAACALSGCLDRSMPGLPQARAQAPASAAGPRDVAVARGKVEVQGGLLDVMAPQDGTVETVQVAEGSAVKRGQVLVKLSAEGAANEVGLAQAEMELAQAREKAAAAKLPGSRKLARRLADAAQAGATDQQRADEAQQAQRDAEAGAAVAKAEVHVAQQKLKQAQYAAGRRTIGAAQDGTVVRLYAQPGLRVGAQGKPLLVLMPARPLVVRAELNERFVAAVKPGMKASVSVDTDGPQGRVELPARVVRISPLYGASRLEDETALRTNVRVVDCYLEFDRAPELRVGQDVRVNFHE